MCMKYFFNKKLVQDYNFCLGQYINFKNAANENINTKKQVLYEYTRTNEHNFQ